MMYDVEKKFSSPSERKDHNSLQKNSSRTKISSLKKQMKTSPKKILPDIFKEMANENNLTYQYVQTQYEIEPQPIRVPSKQLNIKSQIQEEEQLFKLCQVFQMQLEQVRFQKYNVAVDSYVKQRESKREEMFQTQANIIHRAYQQKIQNIRNQVLVAQSKLLKSIQDIKKRKQVYELIFKQLHEKRENIEGDYNLSRVKAQRFVDSLSKEWDAEKYVKNALKNFHSSMKQRTVQ